MLNYSGFIERRSKRWAHLGVRKFGDGTVLVGKVPDQQEGYLLRFYGPLAESETDQLEAQIGMPLPDQLRRFYRNHNGCNFFQNGLYVYGMQRSLDREDFDAMHCNPFSLVIPAITHQQDSPSGEGLSISSYDDKSMVFIEPDGSVVRVNDESPFAVLNIWNSFEDWLSTEYDRINVLFSDQGQLSSAEDLLLPTPDLVQ